MWLSFIEVINIQYKEASIGIKLLLVLFLVAAAIYFLWQTSSLNEDALIFSSILLLLPWQGDSTHHEKNGFYFGLELTKLLK